MKVGTITFHWATNYGAVLQAYALQRYLLKNGYNTEIIDYKPIRVMTIQLINRVKKFIMTEFIKEYRFNKFRKKYLRLSNKKFYTNSDLVKRCNIYDAYICGSDQIWNESFTLNAEGKPTLSYFLNFVKKEKARISYATSFGTDSLSLKMIDLIKPELVQFKSIGVRENTGKTIVEAIGLESKLVLDPTLLIDKENYEDLFDGMELKNSYQLFSYILHENQDTAHVISDYIFNKYFNITKDRQYNMEPIGVIEWLYAIKNSRFMVTNSYHGVIFAIIFHKPFIVVPVENSGMNNRIRTLLNAIDIKTRMVESFDKDKIDKLVAEDINWDQVDRKITEAKKDSICFLDKALKV